MYFLYFMYGRRGLGILILKTPSSVVHWYDSKIQASNLPMANPALHTYREGKILITYPSNAIVV